MGVWALRVDSLPYCDSHASLDVDHAQVESLVNSFTRVFDNRN